MSHRIDCVFIRKSSQGQDEQGQISNVRNMLREQGAFVPEQDWFIGTVSRRKVRKNADFARLMNQIEADQVGTVYIESQDRWGSADRKELFHLLYILEQHGTRLFDLRAKKDLTESDFATEMLTIVGSLKSEKELQDISYRSLRTRVNNFKDSGSWPTGTHPYGYGKACLSADGHLLWVFQPISRSKGRVYYADADGNLTPGSGIVRIPRKEKRDRIVLVISNDSRSVEAVKLIFDLYGRVGLSRRAISKRLNEAGYTHYGKRFTHPLVTLILKNPAYIGDTHFGKQQSGELHTFDAEGIVVALSKRSKKRLRGEAERIVKENTHDPIIEDRTLWVKVQEKLAGEAEAKNFSPRNPSYYLKQVFRCGHCQKNMTGRTETDPNSGKKRVVYVCSTYIAGRSNGHSSECGYHRITHEDAEKLLFDKLKEMGKVLDQEASELGRLNLKERLELLSEEGQAEYYRWVDWATEGVKSLLDYFETSRLGNGEDMQRLADLATSFYERLRVYESDLDGLSISAEEFAKAVRAVEAASVAKSEGQMVTLQHDHKQMTLAWAKATEMQLPVLKEELDRIEIEIREVQPQTIPLSERIKNLIQAERRRQHERQELLDSWPTMEARERGEAFRRYFKMVTLFWERSFHPAVAQPGRPRKTARPGRFSYRLRPDDFRWEFANTDLAISW